MKRYKEKQTKDVLVLYVMYGVVNEVWCRPCPINLHSPTHSFFRAASDMLLVTCKWH